ncbi:MAG: 30S ribosomal protein S18 [Actinobacteria bacterium]|nr:30S ribosomal protein S18 [Actinomycetota bacterium]MDI6830709.1 30S ribosomal protein S18 [Actinomycetota bacterium]
MSPNQSKRSGGKEKRSREGYARKPRKKVCYFCSEKIDHIDYKDVPLLKKYLSEKGKIRPRRVTGNCAQHQVRLALAIKSAREMALIPYTSRQGEIK